MSDSERVGEAARSFLDDHPDAEDDLEAVLALDAEAKSWTFDDVPLDSGRFGELVSRGLAEKTADGAYRLADPEAVRAALAGDAVTGADHATDAPSVPSSFSTPEVDPRVLGSLVGALALVAATRSLFYRRVLQDGHVVSPGNDPYFFRYWQLQLLDRSDGLTDVGLLFEFPNGMTRPLAHTTNWWFAELLGGTPEAAATVAAWLPIGSALVTSLVLYALVVQLTEDHRIGLAAIVLIGLTPIHASLTALGFSDHNLHQYVWLATLVFALVWLAVDVLRRTGDGRPPEQTGDDRMQGTDAALAHLRDPRPWAVAALLAVSVPALAHAWGGSPLSFAPVALYLGARVVADVRADVAPLLAGVPTLSGLAVGSLLALLAHRQFGWHGTTEAAFPLLVALFGIGVAVLAAAWYRLDLPVAGLPVAEGVAGAVGFLVFRRLRPEDIARFRERSGDLFGREGIVESTSLFTTEQAIIFEPMAQLGVGFFFAVAALGLVTWLVYRSYRPGWLVVVAFAWYYMVLAGIQKRFAAQLSLFVAVLGAVALVFLLAKLELVRESRPLQRNGGPDGPPLVLPGLSTASAYLVGVVTVVLLLNLIFVPSFLAETTYSQEEFGAALAIDEHAERHDRDHPENFVLSEWGANRMYNFHVSGESRGYGYARANHEAFITDRRPDEWYGQFDGRVGYVVLEPQDLPAETVHGRLFESFGAGERPAAHYQLIYSSEEARAFAVVAGATIRTSAQPGTLVTASTTVTVDGESFTYRRGSRANDDGRAAIRVAYPGEYDLGNATVTVSETDVLNGTSVPVES